MSRSEAKLVKNYRTEERCFKISKSSNLLLFAVSSCLKVNFNFWQTQTKDGNYGNENNDWLVATVMNAKLQNHRLHAIALHPVLAGNEKRKKRKKRKKLQQKLQRVIIPFAISQRNEHAYSGLFRDRGFNCGPSEVSTNCRNGVQRIRFNNTGVDCHAAREPLAEILIDLAFPILRLFPSFFFSPLPSFLMALFHEGTLAFRK